MSFGRARTAVHTNALSSSVTRTNSSCEFDRNRIARIGRIAPVDFPGLDYHSKRCHLPSIAYKTHPCQCNYHSQVPGETNSFAMFMPCPACPPSTPSVCSLVLVSTLLSPGNKPKPSLFRAMRVCGFFGIWDRFLSKMGIWTSWAF
jgi:hypothetical protein